MSTKNKNLQVTAQLFHHHGSMGHWQWPTTHVTHPKMVTHLTHDPWSTDPFPSLRHMGLSTVQDVEWNELPSDGTCARLSRSVLRHRLETLLCRAGRILLSRRSTWLCCFREQERKSLDENWNWNWNDTPSRWPVLLVRFCGSFMLSTGLFWLSAHRPHRRRSSVNFRGARHFCPKIMYEKLTKCPNITRFLPEKLSKYPNFLLYLPEILTNSRILHDFCPKNARILHNFPKYIFPNFGGARAPLLPSPSPTPIWIEVWQVREYIPVIRSCTRGEMTVNTFVSKCNSERIRPIKI